MQQSTWVQWAQGVGALATPLIAAVLVYVLSRRQSRNSELVSARLEYYRAVVPDLNDLMCYMTFIGSWKDLSPPEAIALKRRLDRNVFCAAPLFSAGVARAYNDFMAACFKTFNDWGQDALLNTSAYRRRDCRSDWKPQWDASFAYSDDHAISGEKLARIRLRYDQLLVTLVQDIEITKARHEYTTDLVSLNAHALWRGQDIVGPIVLPSKIRESE